MYQQTFSIFFLFGAEDDVHRNFKTIRSTPIGSLDFFLYHNVYQTNNKMLANNNHFYLSYMAMYILFKVHTCENSKSKTNVISPTHKSIETFVRISSIYKLYKYRRVFGKDIGI